MKTYILFYLIYWSAFILFLFCYFGNLILIFKVLILKQKFYKLYVVAFRDDHNDGYSFLSLDTFPASSYAYLLNTQDTLVLTVEELSNRNLDDPYYPAKKFKLIKNNGEWDSDTAIRYGLNKIFRVDEENIISINPVKIKLFGF